MSPTSPVHHHGRNRLLDLLPADERERLLGKAERFKARYGEVIFEPYETMTTVHFPLSAIVSVVVITAEGDTVEAGTIGNEGMSAVAPVLGSYVSPNRAFYQVPGESLRLPIRIFQEEMAHRGVFHDLMRRAAESFLIQVTQAVACNRAHPTEQRLARWILTSNDRVGSDTLLLTQEIMSQMLGVRRATVSVVAGMLQKAGFIRLQRGQIQVVDREGLESASCDCYRTVRGETERLLA